MDARNASKEELFQTPNLPRRVRFWRHQWVGVPLLMVLPVLALAGFFGESSRMESFRNSMVQIELEAPERFRYKISMPLSLEVTNISDQALKDVEVRFAADYINKFSNVRFIPSAHEAYTIQLGDIAPGESKQVHGELEAGEYGRNKGRVEVISGSVVLWQTELKTMVFP